MGSDNEYNMGLRLTESTFRRNLDSSYDNAHAVNNCCGGFFMSLYKVKVGVLCPFQQPGSYWDRSSALPLMGLEPTEATVYVTWRVYTIEITCLGFITG